MSKRAKKKPITEERILQLSNDISEDITSGTAAELRQVVRYWQNNYSRQWNEIGRIRCYIAAMDAGYDIWTASRKSLSAWLKAQTSGSTA